jgi:hypothetical protein
MQLHPRALTIAGLAVVALIAAGCGGSSNSTSSTTSPSTTHAAAAQTTSPPAATTTAPSSTPAGSDLSGTWSGQYGGTFNGTFKLNWQQSGSRLTGTIDLSTAGTVPIHGVVKGGSIKFGTVGSTVITYTGSVSGSSMSGSYQTPSGGGSWSAHKS